MLTGAVQGYFGGKTDLAFQRFIEIWSAMPELYLLIIFSAVFAPSLALLLVLLSLFGWMGLSDYVRAVPESVRAYVPARYGTLGTDGFGRSDTRAALRDFFEVDAKWIAYTALVELFGEDKGADGMREIADKLGLKLDKPPPTSC